MGLDPVDVQDVAAIAAIAMTHATVLARRAETDAGSMFNDSPVSSFPVPKMFSPVRFDKSRKLAKFY